MSSHGGLPPSRPRMRTSTHEPWSFLPSSRNLRSPFFNAASTSGDSGVHVPESQIITVPPPYWPSGMIPSNFAYSIGWSSVGIAIRLIDGSRAGPFGTAQESRTPFHSNRKS
jgi:hypothetical protein